MKKLCSESISKRHPGEEWKSKALLEQMYEQCGRKFTHLTGYRGHVNNHEVVRPFECLPCAVV
jgi:zinc finger/BTB domain-containing protein 11